jgi:hypothetical protein
MNRISGPSEFPQSCADMVRPSGDRLEFLLLSKAGYREGNEERRD